MLFENLLVERDGAVAVLTINRSKSLNALNRRSESSARKAASGQRYCLDAINEGLEMSFAEGCQHGAALFGLVTATDDMREGTKAFLEKLRAEFKGK